jgi:hypothetical protein
MFSSLMTSCKDRKTGGPVTGVEKKRRKGGGKAVWWPPMLLITAWNVEI